MGNVQMWQYSNAGSVPGISTNVDLNWLYPSGAGGSGSSDGTGSSSGNITVWDVNTSKSVNGQHHRNFEKDCGQRGGRLHQCQLSAGDRRSLYQAQAVAAHSCLSTRFAMGYLRPAWGLPAATAARYQAR